MKKKMLVVSLSVTGLMLIAALLLAAGVGFTDSAVAQTKVAPREKVAPIKAVRAKAVLGKPDLAVWGNYKLMPKSEFPYSGPCLNCWKHAGIMNLPTMSAWIENKGPGASPACKAKLSWTSGKAPYGTKSMTVNIPALPKGERHLLTVNAPYSNGMPGHMFQIAKPITLELDSQKAVDEGNENNNILTYNYQ